MFLLGGVLVLGGGMEVEGGDGTECGNIHGGGVVSPRLRRLLGRRDGCEYGCGTCSQGPLVHELA